LTEVAYPDSTIVPGLGDAHFHPLGYTASLNRLNVHGATSLAEVVAAVEAVAATTPPGNSVIGARLDDQHLGELRLPDRSDLDTVDHPVLLYRVCGHVAVANTAALELAGISPTTPDPAGGHIDRDESGRPTGVLRETAIPLVSDVVGTRTGNLTSDEVVAALTSLHTLGLTRIGAMAAVGKGLWADGPSELRTLLRAAPDLPLGVDVFVIADTPTELEEAAEAIRGIGSPLLRFAGVKIFSDGSFGGHTAAMRRPFADVATTGTLRLDERAPTLARHALRLGGKVAIHAIGDLAVEKVLDLMTDLVDEGAKGTDLRVEHASVMLDDDRVRMTDLGVIASMQPAFVTSETTWLEHRLGKERLPYTYAHRSILEAGIPVAGGSDCPVEQPSPLWGMYSARNRMGIVPEEELSGAQALGLFTDGVAAALGEPIPLTPGSPAHLTILEKDPVEAQAVDLPTLGVRGVWVAGQQFDL
jgi:predicted amidohydrolase YtcJ